MQCLNLKNLVVKEADQGDVCLRPVRESCDRINSIFRVVDVVRYYYSEREINLLDSQLTSHHRLIVVVVVINTEARRGLGAERRANLAGKILALPAHVLQRSDIEITASQPAIHLSCSTYFSDMIASDKSVSFSN